MGRKINVNLLSFFVFLVLSIIFYYPIIFGKIPFNGNLLVGLWSPLNFLKWPEFPAGLPFKFMGVDEVREFYPLLDFTYDSFRSGVLPLWNPYNFSGYSHIGNYASAVLYPLHLFMFIVGKSYVLIILKLSVIVLSGFFTFLYLRVLKLSKIASYFGAFAFAFSSTMQIWTSELWQSAHTFLWLPLVLFSIEKLIRVRKIQFSILLSLSVAMSIMGGYIQPTIYLLILSLFYSAFRILTEKKRELKSILRIIFGFFLGFGLSAVQLLPAIEAYFLSPRSQVSLHDLNVSFLLPLTHIVTFFVPDFFGNIATGNWMLSRPGQYYENMIYTGIVPLALLGLSVWIKKYRNYVIFFTAAFLVSLSLTFDFPTSRLIYDLSIPFLSSAIPIRIIFVTSFAGAVLSAIGLEWWLGAKDMRKTLLGLFPIFLIFLGIGGFIYYSMSSNFMIDSFPDNWYFVSARNFVIPTGLALGSIVFLILGQFFTKTKKLLGALLIIAIFLSSLLFTHKYIAFTDKKFIYPSHSLIEFIKENQGEDRYFGYGSAALPNNFATVYKIYSPEGYDPVNISTYNELLSSSRKGQYEGAFSRSDAQLYAVTEFPFKDVNDTRYRIMDMLGVKYVGFEKGELSKIEAKRLDPSRYQKIWEKDNFIIFKNKKAFERVYLTNRFILRTDKKEALKQIYDKNTNLITTIISQENIPVEESISEGNAKILSYSQNKVIIETETNNPKILVLSDSFYPGWKAKVNNVETKIYQANYAFRAVAVPSGRNTVIFSYEPMSFNAGFIISAISILSGGFIYIRRKHYVN